MQAAIRMVWKVTTRPHPVCTGPDFHESEEVDAIGAPARCPAGCDPCTAAAVRESRSNDLFTLARIALEAAIRDEIDLP
jgi:hypothetical protein